MTTGSLFNNLYGEARNPEPEVGMGATVLMWTDRHAATVIEASAKRVVVREDTAIRVDGNGMSDAQSYRYEPDPEGRTQTFTLRKNGKWVIEGAEMRSGTRLLLGRRVHYHDYSF